MVGPLDLCDLGVTERFCDALHARFARIDVLINNAAQTLTRAPEWFEAMDRLEEGAARDLPPASRQLLVESASSAPGKLLTVRAQEDPRREGDVWDCDVWGGRLGGRRGRTLRDVA